MKARRARLLVIATIALALLGPLVLYAAAQQSELGGKIRAGDTIVVAAGETVAGDLYAFGGVIRVNGRVDGDLVAFGGQVEISGSVGGDVLAGSGSVLITGDVEGDVRAGAGQVTVSGDVGEDLVAGSGQLAVSGGSSIGEDLIFSSGQVNVDGAVVGSIFGSAGAYTRTGTVGGSERVTLSDAGPEEPRQPGPFDRSIAAFQQWAVVLIFGALALWLLPNRLRAAEHAVRARTAASAVGGLFAVVVFIVALIAVILATVLIAIVAGAAGLGALLGIDIVLGVLLFGLVVLGFIVASGFLAHAVVGLALARLVIKTPPSGRWVELALLAIGSAVVVAATTPPVVGGIINLVTVTVGLGALFVIAREAWSARNASPPITPAA